MVIVYPKQEKPPLRERVAGGLHDWAQHGTGGPTWAEKQRTEAQTEALRHKVAMDERAADQKRQQRQLDLQGRALLFNHEVGKLPRGRDGKLAQEQQAKLAELERIVKDPSVSRETSRMLFGVVSEEIAAAQQQMVQDHQQRRLAALEQPLTTSGGQELPGLNREDPEQAALLMQLEAAQDPEEFDQLMAELEEERLNDLEDAEAKEAVLGQMQSGLQQAPPTVSLDDRRAAARISAMVQSGAMEADEDALEAFNAALLGGNTRWKEAFRAAQRVAGESLPTEDQIRDAGRLIYPGDPMFSPPTKARFLKRPQAERRGMSEPFQDVGPGQEGIGYSTEFAPGPTTVPDDAMAAMQNAMQGAGSLREASEAAAKALKTYGMKPEDIPDDVKRQLSMSFQTGSLPMAPQKAGPAAPQPKAATKKATPQKGGRSIADVSREARAQVAKDKPRPWKRIEKPEQQSIEAALTEAISKAKRFDFHGALAPTLRQLGVDLGSLPKGLAKKLREQLKAKRAEGRKRAE